MRSISQMNTRRKIEKKKKEKSNSLSKSSTSIKKHSLWKQNRFTFVDLIWSLSVGSKSLEKLLHPNNLIPLFSSLQIIHAFLLAYTRVESNKSASIDVHIEEPQFNEFTY